ETPTAPIASNTTLASTAGATTECSLQQIQNYLLKVVDQNKEIYDESKRLRDEVQELRNGVQQLRQEVRELHQVKQGYDE
ncbi:unnamed protein product, partial [Rotaria sp. Silwood2]